MAYTFSKIASVTVGSGGSTAISFNNIPQNYKDLIVKLSTRDTYSAVINTMYVAFNGSSKVYGTLQVSGNGSTAGTSYLGNGGSIYWTHDGSTATTSTFASAEVYIPNYTSNNYKSVTIDSATENNATTGINNFISGLWSNPTAISSISFTFDTAAAQYSTATLYGIRAEV